MILVATIVYNVDLWWILQARRNTLINPIRKCIPGYVYFLYLVYWRLPDFRKRRCSRMPDIGSGFRWRTDIHFCLTVNVQHVFFLFQRIQHSCHVLTIVFFSCIRAATGQRMNALSIYLSKNRIVFVPLDQGGYYSFFFQKGCNVA